MTSELDENAGADLLSIPISALEHVAYCERQAALIHLEATWTENLDTLRGDLVHRGVDIPAVRQRHDVVVIRSLPVASQRYGLHGVCDLVEIFGEVATPVEYKVGPYRAGGPAEVQLAGQAACLQEAGFTVPSGYIYSASSRRRYEVAISDQLLARMQQAASCMRELLARDRLPHARNDTRCRRCSLRDDCLPELTGHKQRRIDVFVPRPLGAWRD
jgi:CRISPR-associated exonuclease Cas4